MCDDASKEGNVAVRRITYGAMYLNHDLHAKSTQVTLDGNGSEWKDNTDALFVGSLSQAQASVRFTSDGDNVYVLIERLDDHLSSSGDEVDIFFAPAGSSDYYKLVVNGKGIASIKKFKDKKAADFTSGAKASAVCVGTVGNDDDTDRGYCVEVMLPSSEFGISLADGMCVTANIKNTDAKQKFELDLICGHEVTKMDTWTYVSMK
jgi:hypothetical protein